MTIRDVKFIDADGNSSTGISAARHLQEEKNQYEGYLTEDVLKKVIEANAAVNSSPEAQSDDIQENNKAAAKGQGFADIREMINLAFGEIDNYDYYRINNVSEDEVGSLYEQRIAGLKNYLNRDDVTEAFSEDEKEWLINKYESLDTPLYYEYADGWKALLDSQYLPTLMMITVLIIGFLVSGIFSDEFTWKADSIFFSAKLGRGKAILSKMGAGFLITTVLYWSVVLLFGFIVLAVLGFGGGGCAVQTGVSNWNSIYNITYFQDYLLSTFGGYIGSLFIVTLAMLVSAKTHSTVFAITIPFILTCIPPFVGRLDDICSDGVQTVRDICDIFRVQNCSTQVLCASLKQPYHVEQMAKAGAGYATIPYAALKMCFEHPLSEKGIEMFMADWDKLQKETAKQG